MIRLVSVIILLVIISACTPSQQVINSWKNPDVKAKEKYESIFIIAFAQETAAKIAVETNWLKLLNRADAKL